MRRRSSAVSKRSSRSIEETSSAPRSSSRKTGGPTARSGRLDALLVVADKDHILLLSGNGDLIEPDDGLLAIGSGGPFALAAARALLQHTELSAAAIAQEAMRIAAAICVYTNDRIVLEELS